MQKQESIITSDFRILTLSRVYNLSMFGALAVTAAAACAAGYQTMAPRGQWYGQTFTGLRRGTQKLALTFDDGPNDPYTFRLLDILAKHDVRGTFFMIGRFVRQCPEIARKVCDAGHVIGNHTFNHPLLIFKPESEIRGELTGCKAALNDAVGAHSDLFRPPFGGRRPAVLRIAREIGLHTVMWNVTGYDWNAKSAEQIQRKVANQVRGGDVILLHDGGHRAMGTDRSLTIVAVESMISRYKDEGYQFVTIPEMMRALAEIEVV
jgi:peptidoglycan-N-acetylglucosamine deacetylase